jgi:hypothetical protein
VVVVVAPTEVQMGYILTSLTPVQRAPAGSAAEGGTFAGSRELHIVGKFLHLCLEVVVEEQVWKARMVGLATLLHVEGRPLLLFLAWQEELGVLWQLGKYHRQRWAPRSKMWSVMLA